MVKGKVFLHVGGPKTGTTAIQTALMQQRTQLEDLGVLYPGREINQGYCFHPLKKVEGFGGYCSNDPADWSRLCRQVSEWSGNVILSFEALIALPTEVIREIVDGLGGERVEILITARSIPEIVVSQWQESVKAGDTTSLEEWTASIADGPEKASLKSIIFWIIVDYFNPIRRWAEVVGIEKVTLQVVDIRRPLKTLRNFEEICGLPLESLHQKSEQVTNRSFTWGEVELIRFFNQILTETVGKFEEYDALPKEAIEEILKRVPEFEEGRITLPTSFFESILVFAESEKTRIENSGVKVVGDLDELTRAPDQSNDSRGDDVEIPINVAKIIMKSLVNDPRFLKKSP